MQLGKLALKILAIAAAGIAASCIFKFGWHNPLNALVGLSIIFGIPASLIISALGIIRDQVKTAAIIAFAGSAMFVLYWVIRCY